MARRTVWSATTHKQSSATIDRTCCKLLFINGIVAERGLIEPQIASEKQL